MTTLGVDGDVSVEDRAAECMTAIARAYEEGLAHLALLQGIWDTPPVPALPVVVPAPEPAHPVLAVESTVLPMAALAEAETATDLEVLVPVPATAADETEERDEGQDEGAVDEAETIDAELEEAPELDEPRLLVLAEAVTAEIPVQTAA